MSLSVGRTATAPSFDEDIDVAEDDELEQPEEYDPTNRFARFAEVLGSGAFKIVYKGVDRQRGAEVAWNKLRPSVSEADFQRLYEEVRLLQSLHHERIIHFVHSWLDMENKQLVFITEYMTSGTLRRFLKTAKVVKLKVIKEWCQQILEGLDYLHSQDPPIIHRDIKCDNIFINGTTGQVKIGDLGLATVIHQANSLSVIGTPEFMAPEFYTEKYGTGVDIWAFGMTMLEMITLESPYRECENIAQIFHKVSQGILPLVQLNRIVDPEVKAFILLCLQPAATRPSARQLLNHPFLLEKSDEKSNQPVELLERTAVTEPASTEGRASVEHGYFVLGLDEENPGEVMLLDTLEMGQNVLQLKLKLNLKHGGQQEIAFNFNLETDTARKVTEEMVKALNLPPSAQVIIERLIQGQVDVYLDILRTKAITSSDAPAAQAPAPAEPPVVPIATVDASNATAAVAVAAPTDAADGTTPATANTAAPTLPLGTEATESIAIVAPKIGVSADSAPVIPPTLQEVDVPILSPSPTPTYTSLCDGLPASVPLVPVAIAVPVDGAATLPALMSIANPTPSSVSEALPVPVVAAATVAAAAGTAGALAIVAPTEPVAALALPPVTPLVDSTLLPAATSLADLSLSVVPNSAATLVYAPVSAVVPTAAVSPSAAVVAVVPAVVPSSAVVATVPLSPSIPTPSPTELQYPAPAPAPATSTTAVVSGPTSPSVLPTFSPSPELGSGPISPPKATAAPSFESSPTSPEAMTPPRSSGGSGTPTLGSPLPGSPEQASIGSATQSIQSLDSSLDSFLESLGSDENDEDIIRLREQMQARKREIEEQYRREVATILAQKNRARSLGSGSLSPYLSGGMLAHSSSNPATSASSMLPTTSDSGANAESLASPPLTDLDNSARDGDGDQKQLEKINKIREAELRALARFTQESSVTRRMPSYPSMRDDNNPANSRFSMSTSVLETPASTFDMFANSKPATRSLMDLSSLMSDH